MDLRYQDGPLAREMRDNDRPAAQGGSSTSAGRILLRRSPLIAVVTLLCLAAGAAYIHFAQRQYRAVALISVDTKADTVLRSSTEPLDFNIQSANVDGQVEILQSEELVRRLADSVVKDRPLLASLNPAGLSLEMLRNEARAFLWPGKPAEGNPQQTTVRLLQMQTSVKRVGLTHLIEISTLTATPDTAAQLANAYASAFIDDQLARREEIARRTSRALQARADELERSAQDTQNAVEQLKFAGSQQDENSAAARVRLQTLESTARAYRDLHDRFLARYVETWQQQFLSVPDAQIVSRAFAPSAKAWPRELWILSAAFLIGISLGSIMALGLRRRRRPA
jgi:uncharacterized protein involved in exopolysaccharide biosynthesis